MKLSQYSQPARDTAVERARAHSETLRGLLVAAGDQATRYLLATNGGAFVALLGFMGASERLRSLHAAPIALGFFGCGVLLCGLLSGSTFHIRSANFEQWLKNVDEFYRDEIDERTLYDRLNRFGVTWDWLPAMLGWISFALFLAGTLVSLTQLLPATAPPATGR